MSWSQCIVEVSIWVYHLFSSCWWQHGVHKTCSFFCVNVS